jgi:hypothetical protein
VGLTKRCWTSWSAVFVVTWSVATAAAQEPEFLGVTRHRIEPPAGGGGGFGGNVYVARDVVFISSDAARPGGGRGRVFRYEKNASGIWAMRGELVPSTGAASERFGSSLFAVDDIALATAGNEVVDSTTSPQTTGVVYVFERDAGAPGAWGQTARIENPDRSGRGAFGFALTSDGEWLVISVTNSSGEGPASHVLVYARTASGFSLSATLSPGAVPNSSGFGGGVSVSADHVTVGDGFGGGDGRGRVHIFRYDRTAASWGVPQVLAPPSSCASASACRLSPNARVHKATLFFSAPLPGEIYWVTGTNPWSVRRTVTSAPASGTGSWLSLAPSVLLASGTGTTSDVGEAYLYYQHYPERGVGWGLVATLRPEHTRRGTRFGAVVDVAQDTAVVGASGDTASSTGAGAAYIFDLQFAHAPRFDTLPARDAQVAVEYRYDVRASDGDGDRLTLSAPTLPAWLSFTPRPDNTAVLTGRPASGDTGSHAVVLLATDPSGRSATQSFSIEVAPAVPSRLPPGSDGCACRIASSSPGSAAGWLVLAGLALGLVARIRRPRRSACST